MAAAILITGAVPPLLTTGAVAVTPVTVPLAETCPCSLPNAAFSVSVATNAVFVPTTYPVIGDDRLILLLNVFQSVVVRYPLTDVVAAGIEIALTVLTKGEVNVNADSFAFNCV